MKGVNILKLLFLLFCVCSQAYGQETILTTFENREQFVHVSQMSSGNYLVSGRTHELGAKTDLVLMLDPQGQEIKRSVLCPDCPVEEVCYSRETAVGDIIHFRTNGDMYVSDINLEEHTLVENIGQGRYESIQAYQILEHNNFVLIAAFVVKDNVRGLLHVAVDTRDRRIYPHKFNSQFPDISGSIGIGSFSDQSVVDGFNSVENGVSSGHLLRLSRDRQTVAWQTDLEFGDVILEDVTVTWDQRVFAVGTMQDPDDPTHRMGLFVGLDENGNVLTTETFKSPFNDVDSYDTSVKSFESIRGLPTGRLGITGLVGGRKQGENFSDAIYVRMSKDGEIMKEIQQSAVTTSSVAVNHLWLNDRVVVISNAFNGSSNAGAFFSINFPQLTSARDLPFVDEDLVVYPNPTDGKLNVNWPEKLDNAIIYLYDSAGAILYAGVDTELDLSTYDAGLYIVHLISEDKQAIQRVTKF